MDINVHYITGEMVHAGDRVQYRGDFGTVVFVSDGDLEEFSPGYEDYTGYDRGVLVCNDDGATSLLAEPDEMLSFIDRG
jgi:hypothetical protein